MKRDANKPFGHTGPAWAEKAQAYRILAEETNDVPYALDRGGRVLHVGPQIAAYGLDPADIISRPFTDFLAPADRGRMQADFLEGLAGGPDSITEFRIIGGDGRLHWVEDYGRLQRDEDGNVTGVVGFLRDIGARKKAEATNEATMTKLRQLEDLVNRSPVIVFLWRIAEGWPVEYVSENISQLGYSPEDIMSGRVSWPGITQPEDRVRLEQEVQTFLEAGRTEWEQNYRIKTADGQWRWIEDRNIVIFGEDGKISHIQGALVDVTARVEANEARRQSDESFRLMFENATDAILWADPDTQCITNCNRAAEMLFGKPKEELLGTHALDLYPPEEKARALPQFMKLIRGSGPLQSDTWILRKNGERRSVHISADAVGIGGKRTLQAFFRDITEQKRLEHEILAVSDREKETLGHALHDSLGQHLTGLALKAKALQHDLSGEKSPHADVAGQLARLASEAVRESRNIARGLSPVDVVEEGLGQALKILANTTRTLYGTDCRCRIDTPGTIRDYNKALHLYHVAQESVTNAVRHAAPSRISIHLATGSKGRLAVKDDGTGMPDNPGDRRGMGLRIMQYRAQMIGAELSIHPNPGGGTVVTCTFDNR